MKEALLPGRRWPTPRPLLSHPLPGRPDAHARQFPLLRLVRAAACACTRSVERGVESEHGVGWNTGTGAVFTNAVWATRGANVNTAPVPVFHPGHRVAFPCYFSFSTRETGWPFFAINGMLMAFAGQASTQERHFVHSLKAASDSSG